MPLNDVPLTGQSLNQTRIPINQNFSVLNMAFTVDHVSYNLTGQGKHNKVTFPVQASTPTFLAGEEGLYNQVLTGKSELYVHKQTQLATADIPMTASALSTSTPALGDTGWTWLPSGYYHYFSFASGNGLTTITINPAPPSIISNVLLTPSGGGTGYVNLQVRLVDILNNSQFRVFVSVNGVAANGSFRFLVIGY